MLMTLPLTLLIAASIYLEDRGGVFFTGQGHVGRQGVSDAEIRSMVVDAERTVQCIGMENDPRITRVGRLLRGTAGRTSPVVEYFGG